MKKEVKEYVFSQIVGIMAENIDEAWEIFNSISRDEWDIKEIKNKDN